GARGWRSRRLDCHSLRDRRHLRAIADKTKAFARDGADQPLRLAVVLHGLAGGIDTAVERRVRHDAVAPDARDQVVLADDAVAAFDQKQQQIEHLGLHWYADAVAGQFAQIAVKFVIPKAKSQRGTPVPLLKQKSGISHAKHHHPEKSWAAQ